MEFRVLKLTAKGNLLLDGGEGKGAPNKLPLFFQGKRVAELFDTIGRVEKPLYLATPADPAKAEELVGKTLADRK